MKLIGLVIGLVLGGLFTWLLLPKLKLSSGAGLNPPQAAISSGEDKVPGVAVPLQREEEIRDRVGLARLDFFRMIKRDHSAVVERFSTPERLDTLDLTLVSDDDRALSYVSQYILGPAGKQYGYKRARLFVKNPPGSVESLRIVADAGLGEDGRWTLFKK